MIKLALILLFTLTLTSPLPPVPPPLKTTKPLSPLQNKEILHKELSKMKPISLHSTEPFEKIPQTGMMGKVDGVMNIFMLGSSVLPFAKPVASAISGVFKGEGLQKVSGQVGGGGGKRLNSVDRIIVAVYLNILTMKFTITLPTPNPSDTPPKLPAVKERPIFILLAVNLPGFNKIDFGDYEFTLYFTEAVKMRKSSDILKNAGFALCRFDYAEEKTEDKENIQETEKEENNGDSVNYEDGTISIEEKFKTWRKIEYHKLYKSICKHLNVPSSAYTLGFKAGEIEFKFLEDAKKFLRFLNEVTNFIGKFKNVKHLKSLDAAKKEIPFEVVTEESLIKEKEATESRLSPEAPEFSPMQSEWVNNEEWGQIEFKEPELINKEQATEHIIENVEKIDISFTPMKNKPEEFGKEESSPHAMSVNEEQSPGFKEACYSESVETDLPSSSVKVFGFTSVAEQNETDKNENAEQNEQNCQVPQEKNKPEIKTEAKSFSSSSLEVIAFQNRQIELLNREIKLLRCENEVLREWKELCIEKMKGSVEK